MSDGGGAVVAPGVAPPAVSRGTREWLADAAERWGVLAAFVVMLIVFSLLSPDVFPTWRNAVTVFDQTSIVILLAVGLTFVLASGEFDLSFPNVFVLVSGVAVVGLTEWGASPAMAVLIGLGVGLGTGLINGIVVSTRRASSFIATLALGSVYTGLMFGIAGEAPIVEGVPQGYISIAEFHIGDITATMIAALVVVVLGAIALSSTVFGRHVQATGSNPEAAEVAGVNVTLIRIGVFVVLGVCVAIASIMQSSISGAHYPGGGAGLFLPPFVAAFIGTSVLGRGQFNIFGTVVGALFISTLQTGLLLQSIPAWVISVVQGVVLLAAVLVAAQTRRRRQ